MILETINSYEDFRQIQAEDYPALCSEIRDFLINKISEHGGHLASNLGAVELTVALLSSFDLPEDKIIYDVGHQSYTHKLLTGRREGFDMLRESGGISGFPKTSESVYDAFDTGHSTTSISAGLGMVAARDLAGQDHYVTAVIGDGSLSGGMAYEALNNAAKLDTNFIIVLNDNNMSISENVGGMSTYLAAIRTTTGYQELKNEVKSSLYNLPGGERIVNKISRTKSTIKSMFVPGMFFEELGIVYIGPVNGHDIHAVKKALKEAKNYNGAVLVHVITQKGAGYEPARKHPRRFHGIGPFDVTTGKPLKEKKKPEYADIVSKTLCDIAAVNPKVCAITAAMEDGTGLRRFHKFYPDRFFDVGIAESHAVTFAAGLSAGGMIPVVAIYSSFMQRAFDQILHDVALTGKHVVFLLDRAGLVGSDGPTHHGIFDVSYLSQIPGMCLMAPKNRWEFADMLRFAVEDCDGPVAVRYPRGDASEIFEDKRTPLEQGRFEVLHEGEKVALVALGSTLNLAENTRKILEDKGVDATLINARFVKPLDITTLSELMSTHDTFVTFEENVKTGGFGEQVIAALEERDFAGRFIDVSLPDRFIEHGDMDYLYSLVGFDAQEIAERILSI